MRALLVLMMCMVTAVFAYILDSFWTDAQQYWRTWDRSKQGSFACTVGLLHHIRIHLVACQKALHHMEAFQNRVSDQPMLVQGSASSSSQPCTEGSRMLPKKGAGCAF